MNPLRAGFSFIRTNTQYCSYKANHSQAFSKIALPPPRTPTNKKVESDSFSRIRSTYPNLDIQPNETVQTTFYKCAQKRGERIAYNCLSNGQWKPISWHKYFAMSKSFAKGLHSLSVSEKSSVLIQGNNCPEWIISNMGTILTNCMPVPTSPVYSLEASLHVVQHCNVEAIILENPQQLKKYHQVKMENLKCFIVWEHFRQESLARTNLAAPAYSLEKFIEMGSSIDDRAIELLWKNVKSNDPCSFILTSGTTGNPKAVELSHHNLLWTSKRIQTITNLSEKDRIINYLPLFHIAPQLLDVWCHLTSGHQLFFAEKNAVSNGQLIKNIHLAAPTVFLAVPRVWEKAMQRLKEQLSSAPFYKRWIFKAAQDALEKERGTIVSKIFDTLIFNPLKNRLGFKSCSLFLSGAAPISQSTIDYWKSLGIDIFQLYGMSETSGLATYPTIKKGSVGKPLPGTEIKIHAPNEEGEGEIWIKGPHIFAKYHQNQQATNEALDIEGFLHTGDLGRIDENGNLFITGRKKEIIITEGGKNIAPIPIELRIKDSIPMVAEAILIGDKRKFLSCILTLKTINESSDTLAPDVTKNIKNLLGERVSTLKEVANNQKFQSYILKIIKDKVNPKASAPHEHIQQIKVLPTPLRPGYGMTESMKIQRQQVIHLFKKEIASIYSVS